MKTVMYITVGLSLADKVELRFLRNPGLGAGKKSPKNRNELIYGLQQYYSQAFANFKDFITSEDAADEFPGAEIESFYFWLQSQIRGHRAELSEMKVVLLPTDTGEAKVCADVIKGILQEEIWPSFSEQQLSIEVLPFPLDPGDHKEFPNQISAFMKDLEGWIKKHRKEGYRQQVLNITGGYKGLIPFFSLFGFLNDGIQVVYKHEQAEALTIIPPLPITWDFQSFDEYRSLVRGLGQLVGPPPSRFRALFQQSAGRWQHSEFGQFLQELYERNRLRRFGYGARLMRHLPDKRRNALEERIPRWEHIWIGDLIPETVEHSRWHNVRLLGYAADLLEPMIEQGQPLLTEQELYLLICCLWLHDIGHTSLTYDVSGVTIPIARFPSLVRRWHNFTSADLIRKRDYLPEDEREAVALISQYNRRKMPLQRGSPEFRDKVFDSIKAKPLQKVCEDLKSGGHPLMFCGEQMQTNRVLLLCALLRVLDGCDLQSDRVVDEHFWIERRKRTHTELEFRWDRLDKEIWPVLEDSWRDKLQELKESLSKAYTKWQALEERLGWEPATQVEEHIDQVADGIPRLLKEILLPANPAKALDAAQRAQRVILLEALSLLDQIAFKMRQEAHYRKHSQVELVYLTPLKDRRYRIDLRVQDEANYDKLKGDITDELTPEVKSTLEADGVSFE